MNFDDIKPKDVLIIDYGVGNILSITNALDYLGYTYQISNSKKDIINAKAYILPGVGAFSEAMNNLHELNLIPILEQEVLIKKKPILGICLGMQILAQDSQENGFHQGLGWIKGHILKINPSIEYKVPHVGWNDVIAKKESPLVMQNGSVSHFYFDHSYHFVADENVVVGTCQHGNEITAAIQKENIFGVQFHPEKSQTAGLKLYRRFFNHIKNA
jgi:imidazole glycerol-phosphate synthase subunit HisH